MPYAEREFTCAGCGAPIVRRAAPTARPRCIQCGIARSVEVMTQIHQRDGDAYEQWLLASLESLTRRLIAYRNRRSYEDAATVLKGK